MKSADKPTIFLLDLEVLNEAKWTWAQKRYNKACLSLSTASNMDGQLLCQKSHRKSCQKFSVMKTKKMVFPEK